MPQRLIRIAIYALLALIGILVIIQLFNINPQPFSLSLARLLGGRNLVDFQEVFEQAPYETTIRVCSVHRVDTDGDNFDEWLVFYQSDPIKPHTFRQPCPDSSPWLGTIYDMDRGEPPVVFPYRLRPPNGDSLGDSGTSFELREIVANVSNTTGNSLDAYARTEAIPELLIYGQLDGYSQLNTYGQPERINNQLTIFKFQQNTVPFDTPNNTPPRYRVIGAFTGSGGVLYDPDTKQVTVSNQSPLGRSQLAVINTYELQDFGDEQTYMSSADPSQLAHPKKSTIDFAFGPPEDILNTEFPEQIVLAFYKSIDQDIAANFDWDPKDFLAPRGTEKQCVKDSKAMSDAMAQYENGNFAYFFTTDLATSINASDIFDLSFIQLQYFPKLETNPAESTLLGDDPICGRVDIQLFGGDPTKIPDNLLSYEMIYLGAQWKINRRLQ